MQKLELKKISPDKEQPRKLFSADKMASLKDSIKRYGIMNPLIVEKVGKDKYLIIDGERRFRAAGELSLKEVPVIVIQPKSVVDKLIQQFQIQEQHENWTAVEKAIALANLSKELKLTTKEVCKVLTIKPRVAEQYLSFSRVLSKDEFVRAELPLKWSEAMLGLKNLVKRLYRDSELEYDRPFEKKFEVAFIRQVRDGLIESARDVGHLKDAFRKDIKSVQQFVEDEKASPAVLFAKTKAKGYYYLRAVSNYSSYLHSYINRLNECGDAEIDKITYNRLAGAHKALGELLNKVA